MKFLHTAIFAAMLVASTHGLKCYSGYSVGGQNACTSTDMPLSTSCTKCVSPVALEGSTATPVIYGGGCGPTETGSRMNCATSKTQCEATVLKGVFTECTTNDCNTCSPASALHVSIFLLVIAIACALF
jgi:hypothetical protein